MISAAASLLPFPATFTPHTLVPRHPPQPLSLRLHETVHGFLVSAPRRPRTESLISGASNVDTELEVDEYCSDEEEGDGELIPLQEMGRWLRNKPAGFGEGKSYDTAMEEKLLEEIEQDRIAQAANIDKLRSGSVANKKEQQKKDTLGIPSGTRVRVSNLPRKKNVHRDLRLAFKGFNGITNINPAVMGNQKTREPICKGFAFVDLQSKEVADRFVQQYSKQSVLFGKVQKLITCNVVTTATKEPEDEIPEHSGKGNMSRISIISDDQTKEVTTLNLNSTDGLSLHIDQTETTIEHVNFTHQSATENLSRIDIDVPSSSDSVPSLQKQGKQAAKKKKVKSKSAKSTGLSLPASMVRLNVKERSVLTGVFSKYGGKAIPELSKKS